VQVAPAYISQIEANQRVPSLKVTRRIADVLDLDMSILVRETDPRVAQGRLSDSEKLDLLRTLMLSIEGSGDKDAERRSMRRDVLDTTELHTEPAYCVFAREFESDFLFGREAPDIVLECHVVLEGRVWILDSNGDEQLMSKPALSLDVASTERLRAERGARVVSIYAPRIDLATASGLPAGQKRQTIPR
jgi:transcriptional regulator with XRE-family HTH domain